MTDCTLISDRLYKDVLRFHGVTEFTLIFNMTSEGPKIRKIWHLTGNLTIAQLLVDNKKQRADPFRYRNLFDVLKNIIIIIIILYFT